MDADHAFRLGVYAASGLAFGFVAVLVENGSLDGLQVGIALVTGFPIYLVVVSIVLSAWLRYDREVTDLQPASRDGEQSERQ